MRESEREKEKKGERGGGGQIERERKREKSVYSCLMTYSSYARNNIYREKYYGLVDHIYR